MAIAEYRKTLERLSQTSETPNNSDIQDTNIREKVGFELRKSIVLDMINRLISGEDKIEIPGRGRLSAEQMRPTMRRLTKLRDEIRSASDKKLMDESLLRWRDETHSSAPK